jgi:signal transduction histidine kinase
MRVIQFNYFFAKNRTKRLINLWGRLPSLVATMLLAAPFILATWVIVWSDLVRRTDRLNQAEAENVTRTSYIAAESLRSLFVSADQVLLELRRNWRDHPNDFDKLLSDRHENLELSTTFNVLLIDANDKVLRSTIQPHVVHVNLQLSSLRLRQQNHPQDQLLVGPAFFDSISGLWQLPFSRRLLSKSGKFEGIMVFLIPPSYFNNSLQITDLPNNSVFSIVDLLTGDLILRTNQFNAISAEENFFTSINFWSLLNLAIPEVEPGKMANHLPLPIVKLSANALARLRQMPTNGLQRTALDIDLVNRLYAWEKIEQISLLVTVGTPTRHHNSVLTATFWQHVIAATIYSLFALLLMGGFVRYERSNMISRKELSASEQDLRDLVVHQNDLLENERKFIAREIHDDLGQRLSVLRLDHAMLLNSMQNTASADLLYRAAQTKDTIDEVLRLTRDIAQKVRPPSLEIGFIPAIEALCDEFQSRSQFKVNFENNTNLAFNSDEACAITTYRILQESLSNAARYAQCQHIDINLAVQDDWLFLEVVDDGVGFDLNAPTARRTFGLLGMRERVAALKGDIRIQSQPGQGCKLQVMLPLNSAAAHIRPLASIQ